MGRELSTYTLRYEKIIEGVKETYSRSIEMSINNEGQRTSFLFSSDAWILATHVSNLRHKNAQARGRQPAYGASPTYKAPPVDVASEIALAILTNDSWYAYSDGKLDKTRADVGERYQARSTGTGYLITHPEDNDDHIFVAFSAGVMSVHAEGWFLGRDAKVNFADHFNKGPERACYRVPFSDLNTMAYFSGDII